MQRTILMLGQGTNTAWSSSTSNTSYYGVVQGPFLQNAGYTARADGAGTGNASGGYAECAFACVLSRMYHCLGPVASSHPTLTTNVNVAGVVAAGAAYLSGKGNLSVVTAPQTISTPSYWYDATDVDAIAAAQKIGFMQSITANAAGAVNPSLGVVCDSANAGFCSPFIFPMSGVPMTYINGPFYSHIAGNSGTVAAAGFASTIQIAQDYCPGAFVASWLQWQNTALGSGDTHGQTTCTFASGATWGSPTTSTLSAVVSSTGAVGLFHDITDIAAVPAGSYCNFNWTGQVVSGDMKIGNAGVHIRPAANNATLLVTGDAKDTTGLTWTGPLTWTTFGAPRDDKLYSENVTSIPTSGVFQNLAFQSGASAYGGTPASLTMQIGPNTNDAGAGSGTISTTSPASGVQPANFINTSLSVASSAASTWSTDLTDIAAVTPFNGMLLALSGPAGGSAASVTMQGYSVNFTAPAHLGLTTQGAG